MREIKFRAWDKNRNKMLHFTQPPEVISEYNVITWEVDEKEEKEYFGALGLHEDKMELMQFTGLLDRHGKEIYEGDIVKGNSKILYSQKELENHVIEWTELHDVDYPVRCFGFEFPDGRIEIIGNIYENPELIK